MMDSLRDWNISRMKWYNESDGRLQGYNCPLCKNRGDFWLVNSEGYLLSRDCECMQIRISIKNANSSGFDGTLKVNTFDTFTEQNEWQKDILRKAKQFTFSNGKWFAILGQSGSGKTHICTAIARELLLKGKSIKYMQWVEDSNKLKARANEIEYDDLMDIYKNVEVLVIDDLFKSEPTPADIRLAYELLNYRYVQAKGSTNRLITIISSERSLSELSDIDTAIAGRIKEMSGEYFIKITGKDKNLRMR